MYQGIMYYVSKCIHVYMFGLNRGTAAPLFGPLFGPQRLICFRVKKVFTGVLFAMLFQPYLKPYLTLHYSTVPYLTLA